MLDYIYLYKYNYYIFIMRKEEDKQTTLSEYESKPVQLSTEAYTILRAIKNQLVTKHKRHHTFSDAVIELKNKANGSSIKFTKQEVNQIKTTLKGGLK